jgi:hypothetical protein
MLRSPRGRGLRFQHTPRGTFIGRGGYRRPNPSPYDGEEDDDSVSPEYDQYGYISRRAYTRESEDVEEDVYEDEEQENEDEYEYEEGEDEEDEVTFDLQNFT